MENRPILIRASEDVIVLEDEFKKINVEELNVFLYEHLKSNKICTIHELYPETNLVTYVYCIRPQNINYKDFEEAIKNYFTEYDISYEHQNTIPVALYSILKENGHLTKHELYKMIEHSDEYVEYGIEPLVKSLIEFPGIEIIESCHGHYDKNSPLAKNDWVCYAYVVFGASDFENLNKLSSELQKQITLMFQHFQLDDVKVSSVKDWYRRNGLLTNFGYHKDKGTIFEIAFRYVLGEQDMIFQMIDYLGQKLHYEKL
jgi:hypothetical protein